MLLYIQWLHVGRTLGAAVGSFLISSHGIRLTYLYFGILAGSTAILYMIAYHLLLKKMEQTRLTCSAQSDQGLFFSSSIFDHEITICFSLSFTLSIYANLICFGLGTAGWAEAAKLNQDYKSNDLATTEF